MTQETGIDPQAVRDIRAALQRIQDRTQCLTITEVRTDLVGVSEEGTALAAQMQTAVLQLSGSVHNVWQASRDLGEAVDVAESATTLADEDARAYAHNLSTAVEAVGRQGW